MKMHTVGVVTIPVTMLLPQTNDSGSSVVYRALQKLTERLHDGMTSLVPNDK